MLNIEMTLNELRAATECQINQGEYCNVIIKRSKERGNTIITISYADEPRPRHAPIQALMDFIH